jgi:hypothetical protein
MQDADGEFDLIATGRCGASNKRRVSDAVAPSACGGSGLAGDLGDTVISPPLATS